MSRSEQNLNATTRQAPVDSEQAPAMRPKEHPAFVALWLQYGALFNQYLWYMRWCVYFSFSRHLSDFMLEKIAQVINALEQVVIPPNIPVKRWRSTQPKTIELHRLHSDLSAEMRELHERIVEKLEDQRDSSTDDRELVHSQIVHREWEHLVAPEWTDVAYDAERAILELDRLHNPIQSYLIQELAELERKLNKHSALYGAFKTGIMLDHLTHPNPPHLTSKQLRNVWIRLYSIQSQYYQSLEYINHPSRRDSKRPTVDKRRLISELPSGNSCIDDETSVQFLGSFCHRYKIDDVSRDLEINLRAIASLTTTSTDRRGEATVSIDEESLKNRKRLLRAACLKLVYDNRFLPDSDDLAKLRSFLKRQNLQIEVPDLRNLLPILVSDCDFEANDLDAQAEQLFDLLIKRESILPGDHMVQCIVSMVSRFDEVAFQKSDLQEVNEASSYSEREKGVERVINRIVVQLQTECTSTERAKQLMWLKENAKPSVYKAYVDYLRQCDKHNKYDLKAMEAIRLMSDMPIELMSDTPSESFGDMTPKSFERYINIGKKMIADRFHSKEHHLPEGDEASDFYYKNRQ